MNRSTVYLENLYMSRIICKSSHQQSAYIGPRSRHPLYLFFIRCTWQLLFLWFLVLFYFLSVYERKILGKQTFFFLLTGFAMFDGRKRKLELWKLKSLIYPVKLLKILYIKNWYHYHDREKCLKFIYCFIFYNDRTIFYLIIWVQNWFYFYIWKW